MGRVLDNKPITSQWISKYGFQYDSNCHAGHCRGFERYYNEDDQDEITWITISRSKRVVYILVESKATDTVIKEDTIAIPDYIDVNTEIGFISWLDGIVG